MNTAAPQLALNLPNPLAARQSLFLSTDGQPLTTSRAVAERFGKRHTHVLRAIDRLIVEMESAGPILGREPGLSRLNFEPRDYVDGRGKTQPEYLLTHNGFALLAMGFTGRDALVWKIAFLEAFNALEAELIARTERFAHALDQVRPVLRPVVEGSEQGKSRSEIAQPLGKSISSVTYHRSNARRLGLLPARTRRAAA